MKNNKNKGAVLVTGSSTGIGRAASLLLDRMGYHVFATVRKREDGEELSRAASGDLTSVLMDTTDESAIHKAKDEIEYLTGEDGLWGLVNIAGMSFRTPIEFSPMNNIQRLYDVNAHGTVAVTQAFLPLIRKARGRIINVGPCTGMMVTPFHGICSSSELAIKGLTDSLRLEMKPFGVQVSLMIYGRMRTATRDRAANLTTKVTSHFPIKFNECYGERQQKALDFFHTNRERGLLPEAAAQPIVHALSAKRPRPTYVIGSDARLYHFLNKFLNGRFRDWIIMKNIGLN